MARRAANRASAAAESAIQRSRDLNERIIERAKQGGADSLRTYERLLENLAEAQENAGNRGADWVQAFARAQASFTRELAEAFPAALQRLGLRARDAADTATERARRVPEVAETEGEVRGAVARAEDLPIRDYDDLRVNEINRRLRGMSDVDLGKIDTYERRTKHRKTVLDRIRALRS